MSDFQILIKRIDDHSLFRNDQSSYLLCFRDVFKTEIQYLQTAYVANAAPPRSGLTLSPSEILLSTRHEEIDRTFTGMLALYWIYHRDYNNFTKNQSKAVKLTKASFTKLCDFFHYELNNFQDSKKLLALITMQITNDLGKSSQLQKDFGRTNSEAHSLNHDMLMYHILKAHSHLVPSIHNSSQKDLIRKLIWLASEHNPGQLVQGESPPALLDVLHEVDISIRDLRLKYMEIFLDVSGAYGHIDHEGAFTMTEAVFQSYDHARKISEDVLLGGSAEVASQRVLAKRLQILKDGGWRGASTFDLSDAQHRAKARLFCMARTTRPEIADMITQAFDEVLKKSIRNLLTSGLNKYGTAQDPAVLPTYIPEMSGLLFKNTMTSTVDDRVLALAALMRYLARVLHLTTEDRTHIEAGVVVVEREVKDVLRPILDSTAFNTQPLLALDEEVMLPKLQISRKLPSEQHNTLSHHGHKI